MFNAGSGTLLFDSVVDKTKRAIHKIFWEVRETKLEAHIPLSFNERMEDV